MKVDQLKLQKNKIKTNKKIKIKKFKYTEYTRR